MLTPPLRPGHIYNKQTGPKAGFATGSPRTLPKSYFGKRPNQASRVSASTQVTKKLSC